MLDPFDPPPEFVGGVALAFMLAATLVLIGAQIAAVIGPVWPLV